MSSALGFALLSLAAAGCLDVSFKKFSSQARSRGIYVFACGMTWAVLQMALFAVSGDAPLFDRTNLTYGIAAGLLVAVANILLIESLTHLDVSLGATIYRLNTIGVVVLSFLFLAEPLGGMKVAGVLFGVAAVWLMYDRRSGTASGAPAPGKAMEPARLVRLFLWAAVLASLLRAIFGIIAKAGLEAGADTETMLLTYAVCWIVCGLIYATVKERPFEFNRTNAAYGVLSGALLCVVANALLRAMQDGDVSLVAPIANMSFIVALVISVLFGMERLTGRKALAVVGAAVSIVLLAQGL